VPGILLYVLAYIFMNLGAFAVVVAVANHTGGEEIASYAGLAQRAPWLAALLTFFLLSLIGIPPPRVRRQALPLPRRTDSHQPLLLWMAV